MWPTGPSKLPGCVSGWPPFGSARHWSYIRYNMHHVFTFRWIRTLALLSLLLMAFVIVPWQRAGGLGRGGGPGPGQQVQPVTGLAGKLVMLDPGHGGRDGGASAGGYDEKDIVLAVSLSLREVLQDAGAVVIMVRETDTDYSEDIPGKKKLTDLTYRINLAHDMVPDVYLSIHANSFPAARWRGPQVFYNNVVEPSNRILATYIQEELSAAFGTGRSIVVDQRQYILKNLAVPAACAEIGFMTNPQDLKIMTTPEGQRDIAWALCRGLAKYFRNAALPATSRAQ